MSTPRHTGWLRWTVAATSAALIVTACDAELSVREAETEQPSPEETPQPEQPPADETGQPEPSADEENEQTPEADATPAADTDETTAPDEDVRALESSLLLIMDVSDSMNERDVDGKTRLAVAKDALDGLVERLPDDSQVGLRLLGHTYDGDDAEQGCADTELVHPVGPLDRSELRSTIDEIDAVGHTPLARSLQEAADDFPDEGERAVILVSDGDETCAPPPPCEVVNDMVDNGIDVVIHTVGFALGDNEDAREELSCVADTTGGTFHDAESAAELADTVQDAAEEEEAPATLEGASFPDQANTGQVSTTYRDTIGADERNYYRIDTEPGMVVVPHLRRYGAQTDTTSCHMHTRMTVNDGEYSAYAYSDDNARDSVRLDYLEHVDEAMTVNGDSLTFRVDTAPGTAAQADDCRDLEMEIEFRFVVYG